MTHMMLEDEKIKQTFRFVEAWITGYVSRFQCKPGEPSIESWMKIFDNCYKAVEAMSEKTYEINKEEPGGCILTDN